MSLATSLKPASSIQSSARAIAIVCAFACAQANAGGPRGLLANSPATCQAFDFRELEIIAANDDYRLFGDRTRAELQTRYLMEWLGVARVRGLLAPTGLVREILAMIVAEPDRARVSEFKSEINAIAERHLAIAGRICAEEWNALLEVARLGTEMPMPPFFRIEDVAAYEATFRRIENRYRVGELAKRYFREEELQRGSLSGQTLLAMRRFADRRP